MGSFSPNNTRAPDRPSLNLCVENLERQIRDYHAFVIAKSIDAEGYKEMVERTRAE